MWRLLTTLWVAAVLVGCTPYRMDIGQGNIVSQDMVNQLRLGMTRAQVRFVLGTPLIIDPFHPDRWDYFYSLRRGTNPQAETRHFAVIFKNDLLAGIEGDSAPNAAVGATPAPASSPDPSAADDGKTPTRLL